MGDFEKICKRIKSLEIQGARNVAKAGIKALLIKHDRKSVKKLLSLRPTEPLLQNYVNWILKQRDLKAAVKEALNNIEYSKKRIAEIGYKKVGKVVFTHCHSSTAVALLKKAKKSGKKFEVYSTETRPKYQGRKTAKELSKAKIKVTEIVDSAAGLTLVRSKTLKKSDVMIVGCDAITSQGIINKIGSGMFAELAYRHKIPVYVCSTIWKFIDKPLKIEERNFNEVWENAPKKVKIRNPAFGIMDKKYITGIISEFGILSFNEFIKTAKKSKERKIIILDMDETLIHSNDIHINALNESFIKNGLKKLPKTKVKKALTGESTSQVIKKLLPKLSNKKIKKIVKDRREIIFKYTHLAKPIKGVKEVLKKLNLKYDLVLLSNCFHKDIPAILKGARLDIKLFKILLGKDDVGKPKPSPDGIIKARKKLHERVEYIVGDSVFDIKAGKKLGVKTIAVLTGNTKNSLIIKTKPDYIINSIADIDKIVM